MRQLIRKLQRVTDSSKYVPLQSSLLTDKENEYCSRVESKRNCRSPRPDLSDVPEGYLPVYVGIDLRRFVISAHFLNHPIFAELLQRSAQEYGYEQKGGLKIPCDVMLFEHIVYLLNNGDPVIQNLSLADLVQFVSL